MSVPEKEDRPRNKRELDSPARSAFQKPPWILLTLLVSLVAVLVAGVFVYVKTIDTVGAAVEDLTSGFSKEQITETFLLNHIESTSTNGAILEVAIANASESFTRASSPVTYWEKEIPLGTTVSEVTVPATYRFHIDLHAPWHLSVNEDSCVVRAPPLRPSLPVAIDTSKMEKKTRSGWARFDKEENLEKLEGSLTEKLSQRAASYTERSDIREDARRSVALFVRNWLLRENQWGPGRFTDITVYFPDESPPDQNPDLPGPTITLDDELES
ncbi:MAG: hypothetical protein AAGD22_14365 [Verrucomicrobiota bacterium]